MPKKKSLDILLQMSSLDLLLKSFKYLHQVCKVKCKVLLTCKIDDSCYAHELSMFNFPMSVSVLKIKSEAIEVTTVHVKKCLKNTIVLRICKEN